MSLSGVLGNALTGLQASQVGLQVASNNVANVNTPGYARTQANLVAASVGGSAMGVAVEGVTRITDSFLQTASLRAISAYGSASVVSTALDRLQSQFGGLDDAGSVFSRMNNIFDSLAQASVDPSESVSRLSVSSDIESFLNEAARLSEEIQTQRREADAQISSNVGRINDIIGELFSLNASVQSTTSAGGDTSGAANRQSELLDELSQYMDVRATSQSDGRITLRTEDGVLLMDSYAVTLSYSGAGTGAYATDYSSIVAVSPNGQEVELDSHITEGELHGLLQLRDADLPNTAEELAEMVAGFADALNAAHNNASAYPAPQTLEGRNTGLEATDLHNFTGATTLAVTDDSGALVSRIDIDFDAGTYSVDGAAAVAFGNSVDDVVTAIDTALGGNGSASFANGVLTISAAAASEGVGFLQDETTPSDRAGRGFAHFFGLNDIVRSDSIGFFETGMDGSDVHGFTTGQELTFSVSGPQGQTVADISIAVTAGETFNDIIADLNDATNGVGRYVTFALDADGRITQTANAGYEAYGVVLAQDDTARSTSGVSMSEMFGMSLASRADRADSFYVDQDIRGDGSQLALGQLDIDGASAAGDIVISIGDNRGGLLLQQAFTASRTFHAAGSIAQSTSSVQDYAARIAGVLGARASSAEDNTISAQVLMDTAALKRADVEGVNLDEELVAMTTFQQSYNASARLLQAAEEMMQTLLNAI